MADLVGTPQQDIVERYTAELQQKWANTPKPDIVWWKVWERPLISEHGIIFLLHALDFLVLALDQTLLQAEDKKATVLAVMSILFDIIVKPALPVWAMPFSVPLKICIVSMFMSNLIDILCSKYHSAIWAMKAPDVPPGS